MVMPTVVNIVPDVLALFYRQSRVTRQPRFFRAPFATLVDVSLLICSVAKRVPKLPKRFYLSTIRAHSVTYDQNSRGITIVDRLVLDVRVPSERLHRLP
jgi:hypothetical protein